MRLLKSLHKNDVQFPIKDLFLIGSEDQCDLRLPNLEARQARIETRENTYVIKDLRTPQGVYLNEVRVLEAVLEDGDIIRVGEYEFLFCHVQPETSNQKFQSKNILWDQQLQKLSSIAISSFPVLILGPSGSGKEILSETIHENSTRNEGPFIRVNCSALTETLVESELFGHVKGSFTGAISDRKGAFEAARGGTLFLDEIGDLPYPIQAKLLRALENNEIRPVGSDRVIRTNVRIIAATHKNLIEKIQNQEFRADLFYRLNVIQLTAPSLTERLEDFDDLIMIFAKKYRVRFSYSAVQKLKRHRWPGNIRELKNLVARASVVYKGQLIDEDLAEKLIDKTSVEPSTSKPLPVIKEIEKQMILKRLIANHGNQRRTASDLGMPKSTLHDKLRFYNIDPKSWQELKVSESPS